MAYFRSSAVQLGALLALAAASFAAPSGCTLDVIGQPTGATSSGTGGAPECAVDDDCDDMLRCTNDACQGGKCSHVANDAIIPKDEHPCTDDVCMAGMESHLPTAAGTPCAPGSLLKCDGKGTCPPCMTDADCGTGDPAVCTNPSCASAICKDKIAPGKTLPDPTPGDCMALVCDPAGVSMPKADTMDVPLAGDGNDCTDDVCGPMGPYPPTAAGALCATGACDGNGSCTGCANDVDCKIGLMPTCDKATHQCLSCSDGTQNGTETGIDCGGSCPGKCQAAPCANASECASGFCPDGFCCDTACNTACKTCNIVAGTCSDVAKGAVDAPLCADAMTQACDGAGACKKPIGQVCATGADCFNGACATGICRKATGDTCMEDMACASGLCLAGVCTDCNAANAASCGSHTCVAPACLNTNGEPCVFDAECFYGMCSGGLCRRANGLGCGGGGDCQSGSCKTGMCTACVTPADCTGNTTCTAGVCKLPFNVYCNSTIQCDGAMTCKGFPARCLP